MIKLKDKIQKDFIKETTKSTDIGYIITKFKYAGHLAREGTSKWNYKATVWTPYEKKRRGRPAMRWREGTERTVGYGWMDRGSP